MIDIAANLTDSSFNKDIDSVVARSHIAGVSGFVVPGIDWQQLSQSRELVKRYPEMRRTVGIHPHYASQWDDESKARLHQEAQHPQTVAIGETGLDYYRMLAPKDNQIKSFEAHIEVAIELGLPLFLHQRDAHADFYSIIKSYASRCSNRFVVHCFTDNKDALIKYLDCGAYIGITGWICDQRRGTHLRDLVQLIPLDRLMIETDCPYLLPRTLENKPKNRRNEHAYLGHIADYIAQCLGLSSLVLKRITKHNAEVFFGF